MVKKVVTPEDMQSATLPYDSEEKVFKVGLSKVPGNLITENSDGIYYGIQAEKSVLYVDSINGDDSADGETPTSPLKTLHAAVKQLKQNQHVFIRLHEDGEYVWDSSNEVVSVRFTMEPYGAITTQCIEEGIIGTIDWIRNSKLKRPKVTITTNGEYNKVTQIYKSSVINYTEYPIDFRGLEFSIDSPKDRKFINNTVFARNSEITICNFVGCIFNLHEDVRYFHYYSNSSYMRVDTCLIKNYDQFNSSSMFAHVTKSARLDYGFSGLTRDTNIKSGINSKGENTTYTLMETSPKEHFLRNTGNIDRVSY